MAHKERLDILLVKQGFFESREKARRAIMAGEILVDDRPVDKPGTMVSVEQSIRFVGNDIRYVSRGGLKLEKAIKQFNLELTQKVILDVGASTGGFTDCALQHGAAKVYAVDVGYGQLAWKLRQDPRVVCLERTNVRYLDWSVIGEQVDLITIDVSFISLSKVLPALTKFLKPGGLILALVKPQFEAGPTRVGKKGVVSDQEVQAEVVEGVIKAAAHLGLVAVGLTFSPVKGAQGNIEFLLLLTNYASVKNSVRSEQITQVVGAARRELD